jgi:hypothetical protein
LINKHILLQLERQSSIPDITHALVNEVASLIMGLGKKRIKGHDQLI